MIEPEQAWRGIVARTRPSAPESLPIKDALYHVLAMPVSADRDIPACDRSAMDGYVVRAEDLSTIPQSLTVIGEVPAGSPAQPHLAAGECVRIFTGANIPASADTVVPVEETESDTTADNADTVRFLREVTGGQHIFRKGENARVGDALVPAGSRLNALHVALCATVGCDRPAVYPLPRVSILTTGAELRDAADAVEVHEIRDSNGPMLEAALAENNIPCVERRSVSDEMDDLQNELRNALSKSDVVLITGGVSVGKYDLVPAAIESIGGETVYHGVRIKPGKPQLFATFPDGKLVFGLPGNPLSVMTGMQEFALPALRRLSGMPEDQCRPLLHLRLSADVRTKGKRQTHVLARLIPTASGLDVAPIRSVGSADLVAAAQADGAIIIETGTQTVAAGETVPFRPWRALL
jgi:molybdopterin molybdotransferase